MAIYKNDANLNGLWLLNETSGCRYDSTTNANNLTDNNTVGACITDYKEGPASASMTLTAREYLSITDAAQTGLDITGNISFGCWMKCSDFLVQYTSQMLITKHGLYNANGHGYALGINNNEEISAAHFYARLSADGVNDSLAFTPLSGISEGVWYHAAVVYDGTDIRIYINGSLASNGTDNPKAHTTGIYNNSSNFDIGAFHDETYYCFNGLIDEAFVFNDNLTAAEVLEIYNNGFQTLRTGTQTTDAVLVAATTATIMPQIMNYYRTRRMQNG
jgi:hypothetical protein